MKRLRVATLHDGPFRLEAGPSHHLVRVCRLGAGAEVILFDGSGRECTARVVGVHEGLADVEPMTPVRQAVPSAALTLVLGLPKGPATDLAIRMATEVGATEIRPVWASRTQGRPQRLDRWTRIAESAAGQCGRADVPRIERPSSLLATLGSLDSTKLGIAVPGSDFVSADLDGLMVGPEGGWSPEEVDLALEAGATPVGLGQWVLRTPTAVAVGLSALRTKKGRHGEP